MTGLRSAGFPRDILCRGERTMVTEGFGTQRPTAPGTYELVNRDVADDKRRLYRRYMLILREFHYGIFQGRRQELGGTEV